MAHVVFFDADMRLQAIWLAGLAWSRAAQDRSCQNPVWNLVRESKPSLGFDFLRPLGGSQVKQTTRSLY